MSSKYCKYIVYHLHTTHILRQICLLIYQYMNYILELEVIPVDKVRNCQIMLNVQTNWNQPNYNKTYEETSWGWAAPSSGQAMLVRLGENAIGN